jgi:formylmethanofuran dehydrogenase subunit E
MKHIHGNILRLFIMHASIVFIFSIMLLINIPVANSSPPDAEMCAFLERFHGHICPGSLMGLRLGLAAKEALNAHGRIEAKTFALACSVDGIQVATGTTLGNKTFTVEDRNDMYLILTDVQSGRQVEARLTQKAMDNGKSFRDLRSKSQTFTAGSPERSALEKEINAVLDWFRTAPDADVVTVKVLK